MKSVISIIGLPIFRGQTLSGVKYAPNYFLNYDFEKKLKKEIKAHNTKLSFNNNIFDSLKLTKEVIQCYKERNYDFNLFVGGDHSVSMATISGMISEKEQDSQQDPYTSSEKKHAHASGNCPTLHSGNRHEWN